MEQLEFWEKVNSAETAEQLKEAVLFITDFHDGKIQGTSREFNGAKMAECVIKVIKEGWYPNLLTRNYGIRQQALYIRQMEIQEGKINLADELPGN